MKTQVSNSMSMRGIMLIDCLVYMALFVVVTGVAFSFFYTCWDGSFALRRNAEDIADTLRAGEIWRSDVRNATGPLRVENAPDAWILHIPEKSGEVVYKFSGGSLSRGTGNQNWRQVLPRVKTSRMEPERRQQITAWRWDVELMAIKKKTLQTHPLFTFEAVPNP